jgi:predicted  nucleic acid-binding Zn-ribbon protein
MKNDGKKKAISPGSKHGQRKSNGKKARPASSTSAKMTAKDTKYTIVRSKQDIVELEKIRKMLCEKWPGRSLKTDSAVYRILPTEYQNAVERIRELDHQVDELTVKLVQLEDLRSSFCRILELCPRKK